MQPVASGFGPVALKMEFKKMRSNPVAFCDRLQNRTGLDFETLPGITRNTLEWDYSKLFRLKHVGPHPHVGMHLPISALHLATLSVELYCIWPVYISLPVLYGTPKRGLNLSCHMIHNTTTLWARLSFTVTPWHRWAHMPNTMTLHTWAQVQLAV